MLPIITVFCAFTRLNMVDKWFADLESTDLDPSNTNCAFIVDIGGDEGAYIYEKIMNHMNEVMWRKFAITRNTDHKVNEVNIPMRRKRIAEIHEMSKQLITALDGQYVLALEDDTVFTGLSVQRLWEKAQYDQTGFVTTYEAGRWYNKIIGVWNFDNVHEPTQCWTMLPGEGFEEIDAAGWYCYLTSVDNYVNANYRTEEWEPWGPDVNYGLDLKRQGFTNFVDWTQPCGHRDGDIVITPDHQLFSEHFYKHWEPEMQQLIWVRRKQ